VNLTGQPALARQFQQWSCAAEVWVGPPPLLGGAIPAGRTNLWRRWGALAALLWLAVWTACTGVATAQEGPVVARAASVTGRVLLTAAAGLPLELTRGYVLNPGDLVDTRGGGRLTIDLSDGSLILVQPETVLIIKDYRQAASLRELFQITLGRVRVKINHFAGKPNPYRMNSPTASIAVRGTEFTIAVGAGGETEVSVYAGLVEVASLSGPEQRVLIEAGRAVVVRPGQEFRLLQASPTGRDSTDRSGGTSAQRADGRVAAGTADTRTPTSAGDGRDHAATATAAGAATLAVVTTADTAAATGSQSGGSATSRPATAPGTTASPVTTPATRTPSAPVTAGQHTQRDRDDVSPRAAAGTYQRYISNLAEIGQIPFLLRFNAFPEAHLDSLENPAFAGQFRSGEARVFLLPTFSGLGSYTENTSVFGSRGDAPVTYSVAPQVSIFVPVNHSGLVVGGSATGSRSSDSAAADSSVSAGVLPAASVQTSHTSNTSQYGSGSLLVAQRFGHNSMGFGLESLRGSGSSSLTRTMTVPATDASGDTSVKQLLDSTSSIRQTRLTAGVERDLGGGHTVGAFYRYGWISATDADRSDTLAGVSLPLESTRTSGHSTELGLRLRGPLTKRLFYGFDASWLGLSLAEGLVRTGSPASVQRDRASRTAFGLGLGFLLRPSTVFSFDFSGGTSYVHLARGQSSTNQLLQTGYGDSRYISAHGAIQTGVWKQLFVSASLLAVSRNYQSGFALFADSFGRTSKVYSSFLPASSTFSASRYSDYGAGWRFTPNLFVQYVFSTDYGVSDSSHTVMFRYTFHFKKEK
jgi:hypothetical protein